MGIEKIAILGAGQMGNGIAQVAACAGFSVLMIINYFDIFYKMRSEN